MSYLKFDKSQLVNLESSLQKEVLRSNRAGSYCCTTLSGCNTRKYHGLLVCPIEQLDGGKHVLLSSLDETVIQHGSEFNLGIHKYPGDKYEPKGHKYISEFETDIIPKTTYGVGGVVFTKERILIEQSEQVLIKYTLVEANSPTILRFKPFLAFRNMHSLSKENLDANTKYSDCTNGISICLYEGYPTLYMQFSKKVEFIAFPNWYKNIEYVKDQNRGYDFQEDLFVPGYFELPIEKGESIIFSASTSVATSGQLSRKFTTELKKKTPRDSFLGCLQNSAEQFVVKKNDFTDLLAGYPWYNGRTRQTFIALPGLSMALNDSKLIESIIDTNVKRLQNGLFPKKWGRWGSDYDTADASLWFFWMLQKLNDQLGGNEKIWKKYKKPIIEILEAYKNCTQFFIGMLPNGLISADYTGTALTWMDAYAEGKPVTPRYGCPVEINALWYNAICFAIELAQSANDKAIVKQWTSISKQVADSFISTFWDTEKGYLADNVYNNSADWSIRPNQVIAAALPFSPLSKEMKKSILSLAKKELLTPRGLRTLSPRDPNYKGVYEGNEAEREYAVHQGTVFPWLFGFFTEGYLQIHGRGGVSFVKQILEGFKEEMTEHCVGTISEFYNGNPPHKAKGAISQATSVGEIIRATHIIEKYE